ncbi:MAG: DUF2934 domain-containing protein [Halobacteriales archaeon]|nr:DUF2934 domain-containing protein [Halobacteriales archaeon]
MRTNETIQRRSIAEPATNIDHEPSDDEIRLRAFELYEARGGQGGSEAQDWEQARRELLARTSPRALRLPGQR